MNDTAKNIPIATAAAIMGKSEQFVRRGLISGKLPFGSAFKCSGNRYNYYISPKRFMEYTGLKTLNGKEE